MKLPRELIYMIFQYLPKKDVIYAFFGLNEHLSSCVKYFIGQQLDLSYIHNIEHFQFCLTNILPSIGINIRYLSIGHPYPLSTYIKQIQTSCPNLGTLNIYCCSHIDDIRYYATYLIHNQLKSLTLMYDKKVIAQDLSHQLLNKYEYDEYRKFPCKFTLILNLTSLNDLILLKRLSESSYVPDGLYMIECVSTGQWLTDSKDDICTISNKLHRESIFSIKQIDINRCTQEYQLYNECTQRRLSVLIPYEHEEEHWISSSILSTHRKESSRSCTNFTFETIDDGQQFCIRPCYSSARRLRVLGTRVIVSFCGNENTSSHYFRLHRIS